MIKMVVEDKNVPEWPQWARIEAYSDVQDEYEPGWWTIRKNKVVQVTSLTTIAVRAKIKSMDDFPKWKYFHKNAGWKSEYYVTKADWDMMRMVDLL